MKAFDPADLARKGFSPDEIAKIRSKSRPRKARSAVLSEHEEQKRIIRWAREQVRHRPALGLLFAVPNGAKRGMAEAAWAKAEGLKAGVPDLWLPVPRNGFHGLVLELKTMATTSRPTPDQTRWLEALNENGYRAVLVRGHQAAIDTITGYLAEF